MKRRPKAWLVLQLVTVLTMTFPSVPTALAQPQGCEYWVAPYPAGNNSFPGTFAQPWATLEHASESIPDNGCTVWFKDGTYSGRNHVDRRFTTPTTFKAINPYKAVLQHSGLVLRLYGVRNMIFDGFVFRHSGPGADVLVVYVDRRHDTWSEEITFRNNIFHDSYNNDLLKLHNGARFVTVENNIFYNQGRTEHHMDVNSVTDITIQDNIFFNDFAGSGRSDPDNTKAFITVKDSNGDEDGLEGSERVTIRRNIFLNWEGGSERFVQIGNDGKPYHEAEDVWFENNLIIGNARNELFAAFGVRGGKNITFNNNTVVGDLPSRGYAFWVSIYGSNPRNRNISFYNNIWSDPTGTMGADLSGSTNKFSRGDPALTINLILDNNLYWNGGAPIPPGDLVSPLVHDARRVVADPLLSKDQDSIVLPRWDGSSFLSGNRFIRQEFVRLVERYGRIPSDSPAIGRADPAYSPADDILGRPRTASPDLGAYECNFRLTGSSDLTSIYLRWSDPNEPNATTVAISYAVATTTTLISGIPVATGAYTLTDLLPYSSYSVILTVRDDGDAILAESNTLLQLTTDLHLYMPLVIRVSTGQ